MPITAQFIKNLQRFRLVTFDVTDTLLCLKNPAIQYTETANECGVSNVNSKQLTGCFKEQFKILNGSHPNYGRNTPGMTWQKWWLQLVENVFRCADPTIPKQKLHEIATKLLQIYRTKNCWSHINGGTDFVDQVRKSGKYVGVISNFDPSLRTVLEEMNLLHKFDLVITSYDAGVEKPNTEIFQVALNDMDVKPSEALHIGNKYALDYLGARNSGWSSLLVMGKSKENIQPENITHVYASLEDMLRTLETRPIQW